MKNSFVTSIALALAFVWTGCQSLYPIDEAGRAATGHKCHQCNCAGYAPSRMVQGICTRCGHTPEAHLPATAQTASAISH